MSKDFYILRVGLQNRKIDRLERELDEAIKMRDHYKRMVENNQAKAREEILAREEDV